MFDFSAASLLLAYDMGKALALCSVTSVTTLPNSALLNATTALYDSLAFSNPPPLYPSLWPQCPELLCMVTSNYPLIYLGPSIQIRNYIHIYTITACVLSSYLLLHEACSCSVKSSSQNHILHICLDESLEGATMCVL